jgi:hypothetical protein
VELSIEFCLADTDYSLDSLRTVAWHGEWRPFYEGYEAWQRHFDAMYVPPMRGYWKARYTAELQPSDLEALVFSMKSSPVRGTVLIEHLHGAYRTESIRTSSFPLRWAHFGILISARWRETSHDDAGVAWVRSTFGRIDPAGTSVTYSNYAASDDNRAMRAFEPGYRKLQAVKARYDPSNLFRRNHNIDPHASG